MKDKLVSTHNFVFNPQDNGGQQVILSSKIIDNGDDENNYGFNQELTLMSYGQSATFNLCCDIFTPDNLRKLANELEEIIKNDKQSIQN